jgi:MYXO-CTERM domain-containing protein
MIVLMGVAFNLVPNAVNAQTTPDEEATIIAGQNDELKYDKTSITVSKNTWVKITMQVVSSLPHDFVIEDFAAEGFEGDERTAVINSGGGEFSNGTDSILFKTPDKDVTVDFYCSVTGHRAQGMEGSLIVGTGSAGNGGAFNGSDDDDDSSTPGFELFVGFLALLVLGGVAARYRRN